MMDFELRLEGPHINHAWLSALIMGWSYFIGGLIPMIPYFLLNDTMKALLVSIGITVKILLIFGYLKTWAVLRDKIAGIWGALQTLFIGSLAAGTSYGIVRALDSQFMVQY
ncbi:Ccc1 family [Xylariales sp. PMI_506]|nr:Ccc1 family [Xylariales sp. PMI_506]